MTAPISPTSTSQASTSPAPASPARALTARNVFRAVAIAEALSWAGLLVGMLFKYVVADNPVGVHVFGPIHGGVFMVYVVCVVVLCRPFGWSPLVTLVALAASIPPFATVVFERWADRTGRLETVGEREAAAERG